ncbi:MAG TPA: PTS sugar transporter subunit IIA, partial [Blastocatellia bacterium]|nr:PTS sugar transporter subunit IIA [Blastocatellia bacterium]
RITPYESRITHHGSRITMIGGVIVTHGQLANELVSAAEMIVGEIHHIIAVSIGWHDEVDISREQIERAIQQVDSGAGVLLLTDMFGGTPTNIAASFLGQASVEVVTGVNLPMVIKLAAQDADETLAALARRVRDEGQQQIHLAGDILTPPKH